MKHSSFSSFVGCYGNRKKIRGCLEAPFLDSISSYDIEELNYDLASVMLIHKDPNSHCCSIHVGEINGLKVIFHGELYNLENLRRDVPELEIPQDSSPIPHIISALFRRYGTKFAVKLNGMFSIIIYNCTDNSLYLYVDRYGAAFPIFYSEQGYLLFASQLKILLNTIGVRRKVDTVGLSLFLKYSYIPSPRTIIDGVKKLAPGEVLIAGKNNIEIQRYTNFEIPVNIEQDEKICVEEYTALLEESIKSKMSGTDADRIGFFLSGGLDSSANVALATETGGSSFKTFGVGFEQPDFDERPYARIVADHFGVEFYDYVFDGSEIEFLPEIVWSLDEPFMENGLFLTYAGFKSASKFSDVIVAGGAADQLFGTGGFAAGRPIVFRYLLDKYHCRGIIDKLRKVIFRPPHRDNFLFKAKVIADRGVDFNDWFFWGFDDSELQELCKFSIQEKELHCFSNSIDTNASFDDYYQCALVHQDIEHYSCHNVIVKSFRMADLFGIKLREPYLDYNVADYILSLNRNLKTQGGIIDFLKGKRVSKYLHREAMREFLPEKILNKPKQGGFVPMALLLADEKMRKKIYKYLQNSAVLNEFFEMKKIQEVIENCEISMTRRKPYWFAFQDNKINQLMNLLVFSIWYQLLLVDSVNSKPEFTLSQMITESF